MEKLTEETAALLAERFGKDSLVALATTENGAPRVRVVNAYYEDGAFYVLTHALSGKMRQLAQDPRASIAGEWFTANGEGRSLGFVGRPGNQAIAARLRQENTDSMRLRQFFLASLRTWLLVQLLSYRSRLRTTLRILSAISTSRRLSAGM